MLDYNISYSPKGFNVSKGEEKIGRDEHKQFAGVLRIRDGLVERRLLQILFRNFEFHWGLAFWLGSHHRER